MYALCMHFTHPLKDENLPCNNMEKCKENETILVSLYEHDNNSDISATLEEISRKTLMLLPDYLLK